jgi:hypothetical protein
MGQEKARVMSPDAKKNILLDFGNVQHTCTTISQTKGWEDIDGRKDLIRSNFPDVGAKIIHENLIINANQLRNLILSERYGCSAYNVEVFVRAEYGIFEHLSKYPGVESIDEDRQRIIVTLKHGKQIIIDK